VARFSPSGATIRFPIELSKTKVDHCECNEEFLSRVAIPCRETRRTVLVAAGWHAQNRPKPSGQQQ